MVVKRQRELKQYLPESEILFWFVQISLGLHYIHKKKIIHRDLKTQNIFMTSTKLVKIGDFGISKQLSHTLDLATTAIGTPHYLSPEICRRQPYSSKSDMWSLGNKISIPLLFSIFQQVASCMRCAPYSWLFLLQISSPWLPPLSGIASSSNIPSWRSVFINDSATFTIIQRSCATPASALFPKVG